MKNFFVYELFIFIFNLLNQSLITSYIKLPVHTFHTTAPKPEETTKEVYYKYFHDNNIYTILELGWPSQKIVAKLNFDEYPFFIYYNRCIIESSFDLNISKTFKKTPFQHLLTDIYTYTYLVDDSFYFSNKETYKMTYLFSPVNNGTSELKIEKLPYTCAEIGLKIPKPDAKSYNYNFIRELKLLNLINDYTFFIEYNRDNSDEGDIIIGVEPHNYNPDKYKFNQMTAISTAQVAYDLYWQLTFNEIYFNLKDENNETKKISITRLDTGLNHNLNIIIAPYDYMEYIEKGFFNKNNCKRNRLENNFYNYDCESLKDIKDFPTIYFNHRILGYTFEITYTDVFVEYNGRYMCKIWIDMNYRNTWRMGKPFLRKYFFSYNVDKKIIGFYNMENKEKKEDSEKSNQNKYEIVYIILIAILLIATIGLSYILTRIFCKKKSHKKKANLLEDSAGIAINDEE